jgi:hypothetical protein
MTLSKQKKKEKTKAKIRQDKQSSVTIYINTTKNVVKNEYFNNMLRNDIKSECEYWVRMNKMVSSEDGVGKLLFTHRSVV